MEIKTKFEIRDEVWYFKDSIPTKSEIKSIDIKISKVPRTNILIKYELLREKMLIHENNLFITQQELYSSLN